MLREIGLGTACLGLVFGFGLRVAQAADDPSAGVRHIRNIAGGTTNQVATEMFAGGVRACASRIDQISNFLTKGTQSSALLFMPPHEPDSMMVSISAEVQAKGVPRAYASATFSPNTAIGCGAVYETVQYWSESCNSVSARIFKGATPSGPLGSEIAVLTIAPFGRVFLIRATANSCVTIKKEVLK